MRHVWAVLHGGRDRRSRGCVRAHSICADLAAARHRRCGRSCARDAPVRARARRTARSRCVCPCADPCCARGHPVQAADSHVSISPRKRIGSPTPPTRLTPPSCRASRLTSTRSTVLRSRARASRRRIPRSGSSQGSRGHMRNLYRPPTPPSPSLSLRDRYRRMREGRAEPRSSLSHSLATSPAVRAHRMVGVPRESSAKCRPLISTYM